MTKEELKKEAEKKYCNGCKWRIEQCLWAWRNTNGLNEPNEKNCSCKEVPAYLAGAEPREKRIAELERKLEQTENDLADYQFNYPTIKELQKENADLKEEINKIAFARGNLEEENAELKGLKDVATLIRANNDTVTTLMQLNNMLVSKNQQLTKAKELLERLLITSCNSDVLNLLPNCSEVLKVRVEAEQFLNDNSTYERIQKAKYNYID
jgi:hypothetical protein